MRKIRYILLAISIVLTILGIRYVIFLNARYDLLCEKLKFGMSVDDVLGVLHQNGDFWVNKSEFSGGTITLMVNFTDPKGKALYGSFFLDFFRYKYTNAYIPVNFDERYTICSSWSNNSIRHGNARTTLMKAVKYRN